MCWKNIRFPNVHRNVPRKRPAFYLGIQLNNGKYIKNYKYKQ